MTYTKSMRLEILLLFGTEIERTSFRNYKIKQVRLEPLVKQVRLEPLVKLGRQEPLVKLGRLEPLVNR